MFAKPIFTKSNEEDRHFILLKKPLGIILIVEKKIIPIRSKLFCCLCCIFYFGFQRCGLGISSMYITFFQFDGNFYDIVFYKSYS
jgi:hypothetical protein